MHWSDEIADRIIERNRDKEEYVCAAGISPSGSIHIGNFRDVATSYFVVKALRRKGKKARLLFSWDEFDRIRKIPVNVAKADDDMEKYIGCPYVDAKNPFSSTIDFKSADECKEYKLDNYAKYFEHEFETSISEFGIDMDYRYQADMYRSGKYKDYILTALQKRGEIFDILDSFRTQDAEEGEKEAYYPVSIYCSECKRDTTKITNLSDDCKEAEYECKCGHKSNFNFTKDFNCKLAWKIDWPMRWAYEGVDFEPGGKDHASPTGSYQTSRVISEKIFGVQAPIFQGYEFIGIRGTTGKMSGSTGLNLTPQTLLKIYQPEVILWLYSKAEPNKTFDFCFDDAILRQYFEFDKQYNEYIEGKCDEKSKIVMENCLIEGRTIETVPMGLLVQLGSVVDFNVQMLETVFEKIGTPYKSAQFEDRLNRAKTWLYECSPEDVNSLCKCRNWDVYNTFSEDEKKEIKLIYEYLSTREYSLDDLNKELYAIPKMVVGENEDEKELKKIQGVFFKNVYKLLINKEKGPRLYLFLYAIDKERYINLLDFSTPMTEEEENPVENETVEDKEEIVYGDPDPVSPVLDEIELSEFNTVDIRVCKILKCTEIRKSHSCYKLALFDGIKERTVVSGIKKYYTLEDLIGKNILAVVNLKPVRISGVTSEGMLLAATNTACGCKVVFVDGNIPEGTKIG